MIKLRKFAITLTVILALILSTVTVAFASVSGGTNVSITHTGQVVDTIEFNGVKVGAKYSLGGGYGSSEYSCAALVMRFYKTVYGFDVWNLSSSSSTPVCSNGESFNKTNTPRIGDIVRFQDRTHWALVKSVEGNKVTIIEQNWGMYTSGGYCAPINRTVKVGDSQVSFFTYSAYENKDDFEMIDGDFAESVAEPIESEEVKIAFEEDNLKTAEKLDTIDGAFDTVLTKTIK